MKRLLGLLGLLTIRLPRQLLGMVGIGGALGKLGAQVTRSPRGDVVLSVKFFFCNNVTDAELVHLKGLTSLLELDLSDTKATESGIAELQKALSNCDIEK